MPAEDEAMGLVLKVGDTVLQSAQQVLLMLLRAAADAQRRSAEKRAVTGRDGVVRRVAKSAATAVTSHIDGVGETGIVSHKTASPDGTGVSYSIEEGVLTKADLKKLSHEFAVRQLQVAVMGDTKAAPGEMFDPDRKLGHIEFTVKKNQVDQFEAALARIVPQIQGAGEAVSESAGRDAQTIDGAKVLEGRDDLKMMCRSLNDNGISVAFSRDAEGCVEIGVKGCGDPVVFNESLKLAARAYGLTEEEINLAPIQRAGGDAYPDAFSYQGLAFERTRPGSDSWVAHDPADERTEVTVSVSDGKPSYEVARNGNVLASSSSDREFFFAQDQPVESGALAALSALDRARRTDERAAAEKEVAMRGKALRGSGEPRKGSGAPSIADRSREAAKVAREASEKALRSRADAHRPKGPVR